MCRNRLILTCFGHVYTLRRLLELGIVGFPLEVDEPPLIFMASFVVAIVVEMPFCVGLRGRVSKFL